MKLHFDSKQEFQIEADKAITDIFEGQPLSWNDFEFIIGQLWVLPNENGFGNNLTFSNVNQLTDKIRHVQKPMAYSKITSVTDLNSWISYLIILAGKV